MDYDNDTKLRLYSVITFELKSISCRVCSASLRFCRKNTLYALHSYRGCIQLKGVNWEAAGYGLCGFAPWFLQSDAKEFGNLINFKLVFL